MFSALGLWSVISEAGAVILLGEQVAYREPLKNAGNGGVTNTWLLYRFYYEHLCF